MLWVLYIFILAIIFINGHDCYFIYKNTENNIQMMPPEFSLVYQQIANPLQQLAEMLPNHNVEVQLEMLGKNNVPIRTTRLNFFNPRKSQFNRNQIRLREFEPDHEEETTTVTQPTTPATTTTPRPPYPPPPHQMHFQPHQMQFYPSLPPGINQVFKMIRGNRFPQGMYMRDGNDPAGGPQAQDGIDTGLGAGADNGAGGGGSENSPSGGSGNLPAGGSGNLPAGGNGNLPASGNQGSGQKQFDLQQEKKPVYMDDLKKALEDFERKFFAKEKENKLLFGDGSDKTGAIEEGKRPLLKKDLWLAMGLKFMTGCPQAHEYQYQDHNTRPSSIIPFGTTKRIININPADSVTDPKVRRIMQLLKAGIKVDKRVKPDESNLQWLQVKIPRHPHS